MAKYACPCCSGFAHTSGEIPNPTEWLLVSAVEHDKLPELITSDALYRMSTMLYKCVSCSAIAIFWSDLGAEPTWYAPIKGK